ncbi:MAG: cytochrome c [Alphaproteobacteria bacterium]|nr:cytochrome c [Alphaproteobacteria bacterium]TAD89452.1 MAG: cytochrome c [Alphaproteobacteria bacterium]
MTRAVSIIAAVAIAAGALVSLPSSVSAQSDPIAARKEIFQSFLRNVRAINGVLQANGDVRPLAATAQEMSAAADRLAPLFPAGTGQGQTSATTRALPEIWTNLPAFQERAVALKTALATFGTAAATGDAAQTRTAFQGIDAACSACHTRFRAR